MAKNNYVSTLSPKALIASFRSIARERRQLLTVLIVIILGAALYLIKSRFIVAMVNNRPITRLAVISELEKQAGSQALDSLITKALVYDEAKSKGVSVSQDEIDKQLSTVEKQLKAQGHTFEEAMAAQGVTRPEVEEQARFQLTIDKIFGPQIKIADKDIEATLKTNKDYFDTLPEAERKATATDQLKGEKVQALFQEWLTKAQKGAAVKIFHKYK